MELVVWSRNLGMKKIQATCDSRSSPTAELAAAFASRFSPLLVSNTSAPLHLYASNTLKVFEASLPRKKWENQGTLKGWYELIWTPLTPATKINSGGAAVSRVCVCVCVCACACVGGAHERINQVKKIKCQKELQRNRKLSSIYAAYMQP